MRTRIAMVVVVMLGGSVAAHDWAPAAARLEASVFRVLSTLGPMEVPCSAWLLNDEDDFVVTVDHCIPHVGGDGFGITVGGRHAEVAKRNGTIDAVVLHVRGISGEPLVFRSTEMVKGMAVAVDGYAMGLTTSTFRAGWVGNVGAVLRGRQYVLFDFEVQGGHSGSPVVDRGGFAVSIIVRTQHDGVGRKVTVGLHTRELWDFVEEFLPS